MSYLKINGVEMPAPLPYTAMISDLDSNKSSRNTKGRLYRDRIAIKRKLELEWGILTQNECSDILNAIAPKEVNVEFLDPQRGVIICTMYVGDRTMQRIETSSGTLWKGLKFSLIEC
ncbi:hypothetical protein JCM1393_25500 [Clostridium carnis]